MTAGPGGVTSASVYLHYSQADLDRAYDQREWASDAAEIIARFGVASAAVRHAHHHHADLAYGSEADSVLDWFPAARPTGAVHIHLHGGAWRALGKHDASFPAPAFTAHGASFVAPHFTNLPAVRLPDMVEQIARAVGFVYREAASFGCDPDRIFISGHSSGAHLAAVLTTRDWEADGLPPDVLRGAVCVSGMYDLEPVMLSARSRYVVLDEAERLRLSPARHVGRTRCPVVIAHGGRESPEFIRQARAYAAVLSAAGHPHRLIVEPDLNHFEMAEELGRPAGAVGRAALDQIAECRRSR